MKRLIISSQRPRETNYGYSQRIIEHIEEAIPQYKIRDLKFPSQMTYAEHKASVRSMRFNYHVATHYGAFDGQHPTWAQMRDFYQMANLWAQSYLSNH